MSSVKDAWDDDWEAAADNPLPKREVKPDDLTRAERKARHAEANQKLWKTANQPEQSFFLETKDKVPLKDEFKPQMKVLSRKPQAVPRPDEEDSEEEARRKNLETLEERRKKAAIEREEKLRRYNEARERLFKKS